MQSSKVGKFTIWYENPEEFRVLKREVFSRNDYYVELEGEAPVIVDAGAMIGDTVLYFKNLYPKAKIVALEPFEANFRLLEKNVKENQLEDVTLLQAALAPTSGKLTLHADISGNDWFTTVSVHEQGWDKRQKTKPVTVRAVTLSEVVPGGKIDLLKLDVEGMEGQLLRSLKPELPRIRNIAAEVHPVGGRFPKETVQLLENAGYMVEVKVEGKEAELTEEIRDLAIVTASRE